MARVVSSVWVSVALLVASICSLPSTDASLYGAKIYGGGSTYGDRILSAWIRAYSFVRDDIGFNYSASGSTYALGQYSRGLLDFMVLDKAVSPEESPLYNNLIQFPLVAQAQVVVYSLPELASDPNLVLDRDTLARIYMGDVSYWNDERIQALNPEVAAKLPARPIIISFAESNTTASASEVFKQALESFSLDFKRAFRAANRNLALMPPSLRGTAVALPPDTQTRINWIKSHDYNIGVLSVGLARSNGLQYFDMINQAGNHVTPNASSVQSAMEDFEDHYKRNNFNTDIFNGPGNSSWPLSFLTFFSMERNLTAFDCTNVQEMLYFVSWIYTNDAASQQALDIDNVPLAVPFRRRLIDLLGKVKCNGQKAHTTEYLIGMGSPISLYTAWAVAYSSVAVRIKYFATTSAQAEQLLAHDGVDFSATNNGVTEHCNIPDAALMPFTGVAMTPGYNIPELMESEPLVLDMATIAAIYLNNISMWNDPRIKALNPPSVADALPAQPIIVVVRSSESGGTQIFTTVLSAEIPEFGNAINAGPLVHFPVDPNRKICSPGGSQMIPTLSSTPYSFAFWNSYELFSTRGLNAASIRKSSGFLVAPSAASVGSAITDALSKGFDPATDLRFNSLLFGKSNESWPFTTYSSLLYRSKLMLDCTKASALADAFLWAQTNPTAHQVAQREGYVSLLSYPPLARHFYNLLKNFTCAGKPVSGVYKCIDDGRLCSGVGTCSNNACVCPPGTCGRYCDQPCHVPTPSDVANVLLGVVIPVSVTVLALICTVTAVIMAIKRRAHSDRDWEINYDELDMGEQLGAGGYGEVYKAMWKGTEVAVKVMPTEKINKRMENSFKEEVRLMTSLRHPNVVLFMAASTKAPRMCIVMEYMSLGSLYDLLHNELIGNIPFELKAKMAFQGATGMHFLHSSGIVHRDLKSLNLLLDAKWNVKVSDFGLTKFKEDMEKEDGPNRTIAGSIHWTAPEIINQSACVDFMLADVYSFGVILWELLTRQQPYPGMSQAAVAVAVIRDGIRPCMPDNIAGLCTVEYAQLIESCWHQDPDMRPAFIDLMNCLSAMFSSSTNDSSASCTGDRSEVVDLADSDDDEDDEEDTDTDTDTDIDQECAEGDEAPARVASPPALEEGDDNQPTMKKGGKDRKQVGLGEGNSTKAMIAVEQARIIGGYAAAEGKRVKRPRPSRSKKRKGGKKKKRASGAMVPPPEGKVAVAFADITRAASLWEFDPAGMKDATLLFNACLRQLARKHAGYEALSLSQPRHRQEQQHQEEEENTGEGCFCMVFEETEDALEWCIEVQSALLQLDWPQSLLQHPAAAEEHTTDHPQGEAEEEEPGVLLFRGLRVRMGVHVGTPRVTIDAVTRRAAYLGPVVDVAARITALAHGGQILLSKAAVRRVEDRPVAGERDRIVSIGRFDIPGMPPGKKLYELTVRGLETRLFGEVSPSVGEPRRKWKKSEESDTGEEEDGGGQEDRRGRVWRGRQDEDRFLVSANRCRWIIDADELHVEEHVGMGSYGTVYRAKWKGIDVAVKRFVKQKLDERTMLEFRAEVALLSELHHPNIVLFIGACLKKPNMCLVTEFVKQGSLKAILADHHGIKLTWEHKLKLLHSAALGVHYLHSLQPVIIHRDLKPSNFLVDENWNVKVSDFGFARIKDENQTMTPQTGSPCWTSPEVLLGKRYDEKADVYSFGVVMWEVVTRRQPFCGRHFLDVSLDVIAGKRPTIPAECPGELRDTIKQCWQMEAVDRPCMEEVLARLDNMLANGSACGCTGHTASSV